MTDSTNKPAATLRAAGGLKATIWRNETEGGNVVFNTTFSRSYKKADDTWADTSSFGQRDLLPLAKLASEADTKIRELILAERGGEGRTSAKVGAEAGNASRRVRQRG